MTTLIDKDMVVAGAGPHTYVIPKVLQIFPELSVGIFPKICIIGIVRVRGITKNVPFIEIYSPTPGPATPTLITLTVYQGRHCNTYLLLDVNFV